MALAPSLTDDARYLALKARDARFDGRFFTGVTSTGIYCRPVCAVRTPQRKNCRFFDLAAQAEGAGFRPCLRCRPELAPQAAPWTLQDASGILLRQALRLLDAPETWCHPQTGPAAGSAWMARLAARLGISDRHLRRIFQAQLGISPLQYLQTRRLLAAKQLLTDTALPVTQVALASGFASLRRFNAAFGTHYGLNPTQLRRALPCAPAANAQPVRLGYRPPLDVAALLDFFAARSIPGLELVQGLTLRRTLQWNASASSTSHPANAASSPSQAGWLELEFDPQRPQLLLRCSDSLQPMLAALIWRVRALLDLDADPQAIQAVLQPFFPQGEGLRVPGCLDGFELAVRAILGQQITVAAARTLAARLVAQWGEPISTPWPPLQRLFPRPATLAAAPGEALGRLGIVRQRQAAIVALAQAVDQGQLDLQPHANVAASLAALRQLPGIGDWTAQYIAMRALRWPDAFPAGDVALHKALGLQGQPQPARAASHIAQAWRPWRSYGVIRAWDSLLKK